TTPPEIHPLSLHDALPISDALGGGTRTDRIPGRYAALSGCFARQRGPADSGHDDRSGDVVTARTAGLAARESAAQAVTTSPDRRSEEHTSELQSLAYLVCR